MGLRVNNNIAAINAYRNLSITEGQMGKSLEKLSSGFRINRAGDDAAGLAISEQLRSQVNGLKVAQRNAQDGISVIQTAEGGLTEVHALLQRVRDLAVQASNTGANDVTARQSAAKEVESALAEIDRIASATKFGGTALLAGSKGNPAKAAEFAFQVGSEGTNVDRITVAIDRMNVTGLDLNGVDAKVTGLSVAASALQAASPGVDAQITLTDEHGFAKSATITYFSDPTNVDLATEAGLKTYVEGLQAAVDTAFGEGVIKAEVVADSGTPGNFFVSFSTVNAAIGTKLDAVEDAAADADTDFGFTAPKTATVSETNGSLKALVQAGSTSAIGKIDAAITEVSSQRGALGAAQNRLEHTIANLAVTTENLSASESRIRDTDMAQEMTAFTRAQILVQAGTAMLAQANSAPQAVLQLLRG